MIIRAMHVLLGLTLVLLPMIGLGTVVLLTGKDTGAGFQPAYLTMALAILGGIIGYSLKHGGPRQISEALFTVIPPSYLFVFVGVFGVVILSALGFKIAPVIEGYSLVWGRFVRQFFQLFIMASFTAFFTIYLSTAGSNVPHRWQMFSRWLVLGALLQVAYSGIQEINFFHPFAFFHSLDNLFTSNPSILSGSDTLYLGNAFQNVPRLRGTACEPLYLGNYLLLVWPFVAITGWSRLYRWATVLLLFVLLLLTWSRGAWLGFVFQGGLLILFYLRSRHMGKSSVWAFTRKRFLAGLLVILLAGILLILIVGQEAFFFPFERMLQTFSSQDWSNLTRLYSMQAAWRAFLLSPVVGIGWGQFAWHFPLLVDPMGLQSQFTWPVVNNFPLQILCETGALGLGLFLCCAVVLVRQGWAVCCHETIFSIPVLAMVATCGVWVQLFTFSQYNLPHIWVALGTLAAVTAGRSRALNKPTQEPTS